MSHADSENPSEIFVGKKLLELLSNKPLRNLLKIPAKIFNRFFNKFWYQTVNHVLLTPKTQENFR